MYDNNCNIEIVHQNIESIRANFDIFLAELSPSSKLPKIIILTEIWINDHESSLYEIPNFKLYINTCEEHRAGGVAVYVDSSVNVCDCVGLKV